MDDYKRTFSRRRIRQLKIDKKIPCDLRGKFFFMESHSYPKAAMFFENLFIKSDERQSAKLPAHSVNQCGVPVNVAFDIKLRIFTDTG